MVKLPERGPTSIEVLLNITTAQFFTQTDVTKDYSFLNTKITDGENNSSLNYVPREYEINPRIPVFVNGTLAFGCRPKSSLQKVPHQHLGLNDDPKLILYRIIDSTFCLMI